MSARKLQLQIRQRLESHFGNQVIVEWPITKDATDQFIYSELRYSPRVDVAVYPFGIQQGNQYQAIYNFWVKHAPRKLQSLFKKKFRNENPRCALAIEVVFNGSSKHILGDFANASMMGLFGVVVHSPEMEVRVNRVFKYIEELKAVKKAPFNLFGNVRVISQVEFIAMIS
jgi:hypothetical protein